MQEEKFSFPFNSQQYFLPSVADSSALLDKTKVLNDYLSDLADTSSCDPETLRLIFTQATDKDLLSKTAEYYDFRLLLTCSIVEIIRLLGKKDPVYRKKIPTIFRLMIETLNSSDKLPEKDHLIQYYYLLDLIESSDCLALLQEEKSLQLSIELIQALFSVSQLADKEPEISSKIQRLIKFITTQAFAKADEDDLQEYFDLLMVNLKREYRDKERRNLSKDLIKALNWNEKKLFGKYCIDIFKKRKRLPSALSQEEFLYVLKHIFKVESEMLSDLIPALENELLLTTRKEYKKALLQLIGKVCSFEGSEISLKYKHLFETFCEALTSKKNNQFRIELLQVAFKYLRSFSQYVNNRLLGQEEEGQQLPSSTSSRTQGYQRNYELLISKLREILFTADPAAQIYVLRMVQEHSIRNASTFDDEFLKEIANLFLVKEQLVRTESIKALATIYKHYCTSLFVDEIYELDSKNEERSNEKERRASFTSKREIAKRFIWIADVIIALIYSYPQNNLIDIIHGLEILLDFRETEPREFAKAFFGMFYNIYSASFKEDPASEVKGILYSNFIEKMLRHRWVADKKLSALPWRYKIEALRIIIKRSAKFSREVLKFLKGDYEFDQAAKNVAVRRVEKFCDRGGTYDCRKVLEELAFKLEDLQFQSKALKVIENIFGNEELIPNTIKETLDQMGGAQAELFESVRFNLCSPGSAEVMMKVLNPLVFKQTRGNSHLQQAALRLIILLSDQKYGEYYSKHTSQLKPAIEIDAADLFGKVAAARQTPNVHILNKNFEFMLKIYSKSKPLPEKTSSLSALKFSRFLLKQILENELTQKQTKHAAKIIVDYNDSESMRVLEEFSLSNLDTRNSQLHSALIVLNEITKLNREFYLENYQTLTGFFEKLLETPVTLPKSNMVSDLSICKKQLLKLHHKNLFPEGPFFSLKPEARERRKTLFDLSMQILLNFADMCAGFMKSDHDYVRLYALKYIFRLSEESYLQAEEDFFDESFYAKLSLIVLDENEHVRKVLFSYIIDTISKVGRRINDKVLVYFFYNIFEPNKDLQDLQEKCLKTCLKSVKARTRRSLGGDALDVSLNEVRGFPELCIIHLIYLLFNNPLFYNEDEVISPAGFKVIEYYLALVSKTEDSARIGPGIIQILDLLRAFSPETVKECFDSSVSMLGVKARGQGKKKSTKENAKPTMEQMVKLTNTIKRMTMGAFKLTEANLRYASNISFDIPINMFTPFSGETESQRFRIEGAQSRATTSAKRQRESSGNYRKATPEKAERTSLPKRSKTQTPEKRDTKRSSQKEDEIKEEEEKVNKKESNRKKVARKPKPAAKQAEEKDEKRVKLPVLPIKRETRSTSRLKETKEKSRSASKSTKGRKTRRDEADNRQHPNQKKLRVNAGKSKKR